MDERGDGPAAVVRLCDRFFFVSVVGAAAGRGHEPADADADAGGDDAGRDDDAGDSAAFGDDSSASDDDAASSGRDAASPRNDNACCNSAQTASRRRLR